MILLDVNVMLYAARREFSEHPVAARWLNRTLVAQEPVAVTDEVLAATMRLLTNHRVFARPSTVEEAVDFCRQVKDAPAAVSITPGARRWAIFVDLATSLALRGNDIPDALLAATALDLRATFATFDRAFRRFPGLAMVTPADPVGP